MAVIRVGKNQVYNTISTAYEYALDGDILYIDKGIYKETLVMDTKYVHLIGNNKKGEIGSVIIAPEANENALCFINISGNPTIYIEGIYLKFEIDVLGDTTDAAVVEITNCNNIDLFFNKSILSASYDYEFIFQCNTDDLNSITINNCMVIYKDIIGDGYYGVRKFVINAKDVTFIINKTILSNTIENVHYFYFTQPTIKDYVLVAEEVGYGIKYGEYQTTVSGLYYFSGTVIDEENPNLFVNNIVLNRNDKSSKIILSEDNLTATLPYTSYYTYQSIRATIKRNTGKWYWEVKIDDAYGKCRCGVGTENVELEDHAIGDCSYSWGYEPRYGRFYNNNVYEKVGESAQNGDTIGIAFDASYGRIWWSKNGVWMLNGNPATGENPIFDESFLFLFPMLSLYSSTSYDSNVTFIFNESDLNYNIPTGFNFYGSHVTWEIKGYNKYTNEVVGYAMSDSITGEYYMETTYSGEHFLICEDAESEPNYNNLILDGMIPKIEISAY